MEGLPAADGVKSMMSKEQAEEAENRYEVITGGISAEQKELEERAEAAQKRYDRAEEERKLLLEKYRLTQEECGGVCYDRKEETHQEVLLEDREGKIGRKKELIHGEEIRCALLKQEKERKLAEMKERCGKEEPVAKGDIRTMDFTEAIRQLEYEKGEAEIGRAHV